MRILVKKGGPLTTLQDLGRYGYQKFGVLVSGAMDDVSLRLSNLLVQNDPGEGALEMTMSGPVLVLPAGLVFALTGADMKATLGGKPVPRYRPIYVRKESHPDLWLLPRPAAGPTTPLQAGLTCLRSWKAKYLSAG